MNYYLRKIIQFFHPPTNNDFQIPIDLVPYVIPFGSRIWGGYNAKSDVDLLARQSDDGHLTHLLKQLGVDYKITHSYWGETNKITFFYNNFRFEVSCSNDADYRILSQTISMCSSYFAEFPFSASEKSYRKYVFEHFRDFFKQHRKLPTSLYTHLADHHPELLI